MSRSRGGPQPRKRATPGRGARPRKAARPQNPPQPREGAKPRGDAKPGNTAQPRDVAQPQNAAPPEPFRLGAVPGATPGRWIDRWRERLPRHPLELVPLAVADQRAALDAGEVDAALVRLPIDRDGLHVIALYDEVVVVVFPAASHLADDAAADPDADEPTAKPTAELTAADLAGETLIVPADDPIGAEVPGTLRPRFEAPATTADAIATVAAGVGVVVVPASLARLHARRDVGHRPLAGWPTSTVALAWPAERTTAPVETFVGIVRGRTPNSSRG